MITIKKEELRKFLSASRFVKRNSTMPILEYVKMECKEGKVFITNDNLGVYVIYQAEGKYKEEVTILLDYQLFSAAINKFAGDTFEIKYGELKEVSKQMQRKIKITDGKMVVDFTVPDENLYPVQHLPEGKGSILLDNDFFHGCYHGRYHLPTNPDAHPALRFVVTARIDNKKYLIATDGFAFYSQVLKSKIPDLTFDKDTCDAIASFEEGRYHGMEKYHIFLFENITYGFIKAEQPPPTFDKIVNSFSDKNEIIINRAEVLAYCEFVMSMKSLIPPVCLMKEKDKTAITIDYTNIDGTTSSDVEFNVEKNFKIPDFPFKPDNMITVLKSITSETIMLYPIDDNMYIRAKDDEGYLGLIRKIFIQPNK